jgi:hypothetical protein
MRPSRDQQERALPVTYTAQKSRIISTTSPPWIADRSRTGFQGCGEWLEEPAPAGRGSEWNFS